MNKNLSPAKRALLEKWLQGESNGNSTSIPRVGSDVAIPISFSQRRQLFLELLNRGTAVNNLSVLLEIHGKLDIAALEKSANKIVARHDSLRTKFSFDRGLPTPEVLPVVRINLPIEDLQLIDVAGQMTKARQGAEKEVLRPIDIAEAPLIRLRLYKLNEEKYLFLVIAHHTISDGWSLGVFLKELITFYREINSETSDLPTELPVQYADYAHWQSGDHLEKVLQSSLNYWRDQLDGELPVLELPFDHPRSTKQTYSGGTYRFVISRDQITALEKICRETDATLFMALLTAYYILLYRYSGQDEIIVGSPIANRNHPELENLIGVFINPLALRVKISGDPGFREMLTRVKNTCLEAYAHQDLPFEKLVEELNPQRDLSRTPIFQVVFNMQNSPVQKLGIPGLEIGFLEIDRGVSQFDLTLMITKKDGHCHAAVEYSNDLFEEVTVARMFQSYQFLLQNIIADPDEQISRLQILTRAEEHHLIHELNKTAFEFPNEKCLHQLFEAKVEETPDAIAVVHHGGTLTYADLNRRANLLAKHLRNMGVGPGIRVGILMERSIGIPEALLGVLKAGGTYVPIHTSFPAERIQFIVKDANVKVLLTNVNDLQIGNVYLINSEIDKFSSGDGSNPEIARGNVAYIMYTSGSTGQPKGVMVSQHSLANFLWSMYQQPGIDKNDIVMSVTPISFDIAGLELFLPLIAGARVVIASKEMLSNPLLIGEALKNDKVTIMQATPATWQLLIETGWKGQPGLKALCGGETLTRKLADQLLERVDELWNMYGPTETTVWSSVNKIAKGNSAITIGQPIGNTQLYILDHNLQPVPVGVTGELHIGGEGVAIGYLNNGRLTNEKFIQDRFSSKTGRRLYKTGDRARYLPDYSIELLGRNDDQVKINGHRIELGEIAVTMMQHPLIQEAIAVVRNETNGDKRLAVYYVPAQNTVPDESELQDFARKRLPSFMMPAVFVRLASIPLTPHGKIDRRSLPTPEAIRTGYVGPRNRIEEILISIWQDVLNVEEIGINDNFFDAGGASIQSLEMVAKANMSGLRLSVENIFEYQTIGELAAHIKAVS
jgi:amino acid adenylation domain-containing protein